MLDIVVEESLASHAIKIVVRRKKKRLEHTKRELNKRKKRIGGRTKTKMAAAQAIM